MQSLTLKTKLALIVSKKIPTLRLWAGWPDRWPNTLQNMLTFFSPQIKIYKYYLLVLPFWRPCVLDIRSRPPKPVWPCIDRLTEIVIMKSFSDLTYIFSEKKPTLKVFITDRLTAGRHSLLHRLSLESNPVLLMLPTRRSTSGYPWKPHQQTYSAEWTLHARLSDTRQ